jgi:hypothetical protein
MELEHPETWAKRGTRHFIGYKASRKITPGWNTHEEISACSHSYSGCDLPYTILGALHVASPKKKSFVLHCVARF